MFGFLDFVQHSNVFPKCIKFNLACGSLQDKLASYDLSKLFPSLTVAVFDCISSMYAVRNCSNLSTLQIMMHTVDETLFTHSLHQEKSFITDEWNEDMIRIMHFAFPNVTRLCVSGFVDMAELVAILKFCMVIEIDFEHNWSPGLEVVALVAILENSTTLLETHFATQFFNKDVALKMSVVTIHGMLNRNVVKNVSQSVRDYWKAEYEKIDMAEVALVAFTELRPASNDNH